MTFLSKPIIRDQLLIERELKMNVGFGDSNFSFAVYIANKPAMTEYQGLESIAPLSFGEIDMINQSCGNGWRKVFNVYAKVLYCLDSQYFQYSNRAPTWQAYRDDYLLQLNSQTALLFSPPNLGSKYLAGKGIEIREHIIHIICGRGYAKTLINTGKLLGNLVWLDDEFAIDKQNKVIVCPYFDYRQLSNVKIEKLSGLLLSLKQGK